MIKRIAVLVSTILLSLVVLFTILEFMPGDPVEILAQDISVAQRIPLEDALLQAKSQLNYDPDKPLMIKFFEYVKGIVTFKYGTSLVYKKPVIEVIFGALPWTLLVVSISLILSFVVGILIGLYIAWKQNKGLNVALTVFNSIFGAVPPIVVGYVLLFIFAVNLKWLPSRGPYSSDYVPGFNIGFILSILKHAILPVTANFMTTVSGWAMVMRANALSVLGDDFVIYAKVRGLSDNRIITSYVGRNAILPLITSLSIQFGLMFGGSPLVENLFTYPGIGFYLGAAIGRRDVVLMQGMFFMIIVIVVIMTFFSELISVRLNPRLRGR